MWLIVLLIVGLLLVFALRWLTIVKEGFTDESETIDLSVLGIDSEDRKDPRKLIAKLKEFLDNIEQPDSMMNHALEMHNKDPGELARLNLGIVN
jgi:hypothetical protein